MSAPGTHRNSRNIMRDEEIRREKIILFDGVCNLCNGSVVFVLKRERNPQFRFASIQSEMGKALLQRCGLPSDYSQAVVYMDRGIIHFGSSAALKIGQGLRFPWSVISSIGLIVPKIFRDWVYSQIGKHRYQWFGRRDVCMVPTKELRIRFYD